MFGSQSVSTSSFIPKVNTFVDLLQKRADEHHGKMAYGFLENGENLSEQLTFDVLDKKARAIAVQLQQRKLQGERALLLYPSGLEYLAAYFGCLYAGVIAVPVYPPQMGKQLSRIEAVVGDCHPAVFLTTTDILATIKDQMPELVNMGSAKWLTTENITTEEADLWQRPDINGDTIAFLQYTSGSTSSPKGVMVSHGNLLANEHSILSLVETSPETVSVSWLPLFHDMGLIGMALHSLYLGTPNYLMAPFSFLQRPHRWLRAISNFGGTLSGGPNFAFELCLNRITEKEMEGLDLSSWKTAFNGAEPVRMETLNRFAEKFASVGFRPACQRPLYGMAESTLIISGWSMNEPLNHLYVDESELAQHRIREVDQKAAGAQAMVNCGHADENHHIMAVDPETRTICNDSEVGEIWFSGPSVAKGYWQRPESTEDTFQAYTSDTHEGPFLRTGDLGFVRDGHVFITGRIKDLIIIRGRNHYPQDIELTVENSHPSLRLGGGAAFSVQAFGEERLVVLQEVERGMFKKAPEEEIIGAIRQAVSRVHELQLFAIVLVKRRSILKTSSGKIMRNACKQAYLNKELYVEAEWELSEAELEDGEKTSVSKKEKTLSPKSSDELQVWIKGWMSRKLNIAVEDIDPQDSLTAYGTDSMMTAEFEEEISQFLGFNWPVMDILITEPSIQELCDRGAELAEEHFA